MPSFGTVMWALGALVVFLVVWRVGMAMLRGVTTPLPPPPPAGELRKVNLRFRCSVCGAEMRMTVAADEDPEPPRHCMEDMDPIAPAVE
jgi:hypothetical protein